MWKRPPGPPKVWDVIEAQEIQKDGSKKKIRVSIQEVPDEKERKQEVLNLLINSFLVDEPMSKALSKFVVIDTYFTKALLDSKF